VNSDAGNGYGGYFVVLPHGPVLLSVTINGNTYQNTNSELDLVIGPLHPFTIIEFLSQPIFF
jgi:hypothetical protein